MFTGRFVRNIAKLAGAGLVLGVTFAGGAAFASHQFPDVPDSSAFHDDIGWLVGHNLATGFPDGTFRPRDPVNRQQMARFLRNYNNDAPRTISIVNPTSATSFADTASCPSGHIPLAGGGTISQSGVFMTDSNPTETGWRVRWESENNTSVDPTNLSVYVICGPDDSTG